MTSATGAKHTVVSFLGTDYVVYTGRGTWPLATLRCKATVAELSVYANYEGWTPLAAGSTAAAPKIARTADGKLDWQWRKGLPPMAVTELAKLAKAGHVTTAEAAAVAAYDSTTGLALSVAGGSTHWHEGRKKWISIFGARSIDPSCPGPACKTKESLLGELWYSEADSLPGLGTDSDAASVWSNATKVVTHNTSDYRCGLVHSFSFTSIPVNLRSFWADRGSCKFCLAAATIRCSTPFTRRRRGSISAAHL